ncbi:MAG: hypothetical protein DCC75_01170 [Proteobacteria bacterium]|nr:MAG: hypothetical protein DCC75_01170 [Pseudomonadota bacterium]
MEAERKIEIRADNLRVAYGASIALNLPALEVKGNIIALIGHNGAGKSTMIKSVLGLLPPRSGSLRVTQSLPGTPQLLSPEEHMAFCPESGAVFADIKVESYIKLWCRLKHRDANFYKKAGSKYIEMMKLGPLLSKLGRELSKGQRRRVQTAIGFLCEPQLFLCDEPFDGLDVQKTSELIEIIQTQTARMSFVISSHRMDVVERLADVIVVLKEGAAISVGAPKSVCRELCGAGFKIGGMQNAAALMEALRQKFPTALISRLDDKICVAGQDLNKEALARLINQVDRNGALLEDHSASLIEAMNYHLRELEGVNIRPGSPD